MQFLINIIAVIVYGASVVYILKRYKDYTVLFGFLSLIQLWTLMSCFYNDLSIYNFELFRYTEATYATTRLAMFYLVFNLGFALMARLTANSILSRRSYALRGMSLNLGSFKLSTYGIITLIGSYLAYGFITGGIPVALGLDRLAYYEQAGSLDRFLVAYGPLLAFALGLFSIKRGIISVNGLITFLFMVYAVLIGHKFSFLSDIMVGYFMPIFARKVFSDRKFDIFRLKYMLTATATISLFLILAFITYVRVTEGIDSAGQLLVNRLFAGQGEIWWAVDYDYSQNGIYDDDHWVKELGYITGDKEVASYEVGMRYLMIKIIGPDRAGALFDRGYLFTMAYPAILIMTFPYWLSILLQFVAGMFMLLILFYLHNCIVYRHYLRAVVTMMILSPMVAVIHTGNYFVFFTFGMAIKVIILLSIEFGLVAQPTKEQAL